MCVFYVFFENDKTDLCHFFSGFRRKYLFIRRPALRVKTIREAHFFPESPFTQEIKQNDQFFLYTFFL